MKLLDNCYNLRWEKPAFGDTVRYYETKIKIDLFGQLILEVFWGRKGTRLGGKKLIAYGNVAELKEKVMVIHKKRLGRKYCLVRSTDLKIISLLFN